jgi:AcrR family transcriptional regulator
VPAERAKPRRTPSQQRSRQRVETILEAAARVFAEQGFDAASTEMIAERAGTSIGSIYQFFPNKLALFERLAARCLEQQRQAFDELFATAGGDSWTSVIERAIDGFGRLREVDPAFRAVLANVHLYGLYEKADLALTRYMIEQVAKVVKKHAKRITPLQRTVVATTIVNTITGALFLSQREEPRFRRQILDETKLLLRRYLATYAN